MRRSRITITLDNNSLEQVDRLIDGSKLRNRSHAIEFVLNDYLRQTVKKAVILAGGQGTKLRPYTYEVPKPLLPVSGRPILEYVLKLLKKSGITEVVICIGYLGEKIKEQFGNGDRLGLKITYSEEKEPLQTGGALAKVKKFTGDDTFLVIHGDLLTTLSFQDLINFHQKESELATVALTTVAEPSEFGQLTLHGTKLVRFYQKNDGKDIKSPLVHAGIYVFSPAIYNFFPKNKTSFSLEDIMEKLIQDEKVSGFIFEGQWFDVGSLENYENAIKLFKESK